MSRAASPAGSAPAAVSDLPDARGTIGRHQQLDAVLARVAGPADERLGAGDRERRGAHPRGQLVLGELGDDRARLGPLDGEHRVVVDRVDHLDVELGRVLGEPITVALVVGGVGDSQIAVVGDPVGEQVVEDPAVGATEDRVLGPTHPQLLQIVGEQALKKRAGVRP